MQIERLNALIFEANAHRDCEGLPWDEFLRQVLADDFALRRSAASKPLKDRDTFLKATRDAEPVKRNDRSGISTHLGIRHGRGRLLHRHAGDRRRRGAAVEPEREQGPSH
jgi:hypothetical protein